MQPSPAEYCLFFVDWWPLCMAKGEWASWAQTFGAVVAMLLTLGLWRNDRYRERRQAFSMATVFAGRLASSTTLIALSARINDEPTIATEGALLRETQTVGRTIRVDLLPLGASWEIVELMAICAETLKVIAHLEANFNVHANSLVPQFDALEGRVREVTNRFGTELGGIESLTQARPTAADMVGAVERFNR